MGAFKLQFLACCGLGFVLSLLTGCSNSAAVPAKTVSVTAQGPASASQSTPSATESISVRSSASSTILRFSGSQDITDAEGYQWTVAYDLSADRGNISSDSSRDKPGFTTVEFTPGTAGLQITNNSGSHNLPSIGGNIWGIQGEYGSSSPACTLAGRLSTLRSTSNGDCLLPLGRVVLSDFMNSDGLAPGATAGGPGALLQDAHLAVEQVPESKAQDLEELIEHPKNLLLTVTTGAGSPQGFDTKLMKQCMLTSARYVAVLASLKPYSCA